MKTNPLTDPMRTATIILLIIATISMMYFLFFSSFNRDMGYASMLLVIVLTLYLRLTTREGDNGDNNRHY